MSVRAYDPADTPAPLDNYHQGIEIGAASRILFISGQIPATRTGAVPSDFEGQCRQVWANIATVLRAADMGLGHLVKVTTFLTDRRHAEANSRIRQEILRNHKPALTVIVAQTLALPWLLEIEAIAAA